MYRVDEGRGAPVHVRAGVSCINSSCYAMPPRSVLGKTFPALSEMNMQGTNSK